MVIITLLLYIFSTLITPINSEYWGLPIEISLLLVTFILIYVLHLSYEELGLKYSKDTVIMHILGFLLVASYAVITIYLIGFDKISELENLTVYNLLFFTVAAFAEELYFRGIIYRLLQVWDEKTAFLGSSLIYGIWTIPVGYIEIFVALKITSSLGIPLGQMERIIFALSLATIRLSSRMIYLCIPANIIVNLHNYLFVANNTPTELITFTYIIFLIIIGLFLYIDYLIKKRKNQTKKPQNIS